MEYTHCDYKLRWIVFHDNKIVVSVIFYKGFYAEDEEGNMVYHRGETFWGDTNEFQTGKTYDDIVKYYDVLLEEFGAVEGLTPIPEQVVSDEE